MKTLFLTALLATFLTTTGDFRSEDEVGLTIYNQGFAVVRDRIDLDLKQGVNRLEFTKTTAHLEPDSVILRDPKGKYLFQILEQNYRSDPVSQELLLSLFEGKTIDFQVQMQDRTEVVSGKIIRSGYVPHRDAWQRYGQQYQAVQTAYVSGSAGQPIIEVNGRLRFSFPGIPLFPSLSDESVLKPTLTWLIESNDAAKFLAELSYVTAGMSWEADYNIVAPQDGDVLDLIGWGTVDNQSGKTFPGARIKLVAGDVSKIQESQLDYKRVMELSTSKRGGMAPSVTEKAFDEYHLYTLRAPTTLHDRETKQVEFVRASAIDSQRLYIYDGAKIDYYRYFNYPLS